MQLELFNSKFLSSNTVKTKNPQFSRRKELSLLFILCLPQGWNSFVAYHFAPIKESRKLLDLGRGILQAGIRVHYDLDNSLLPPPQTRKVKFLMHYYHSDTPRWNIPVINQFFRTKTSEKDSLIQQTRSLGDVFLSASKEKHLRNQVQETITSMTFKFSR